jgi:dihydrofolate reductase
LKLSLIVAMSLNGVIGKNGGLPWDRIPEDMANFRKLTMGKPCIMGRRTFDSLPRMLKGRRHIILSRSRNLTQDEYHGRHMIAIARTPFETITEAFQRHDHAFVIGGAEIYRLFGPLCDEAHVTLVNRDVEGDTYFPDCDMCNGWAVEDKKELAPDVFYSRRVRPHRGNQ